MLPGSGGAPSARDREAEWHAPTAARAGPLVLAAAPAVSPPAARHLQRALDLVLDLPAHEHLVAVELRGAQPQLDARAALEQAGQRQRRARRGVRRELLAAGQAERPHAEGAAGRGAAERGAARCSTADEAVLWLVEERARVDDCRAVDAARERSEADADAAKARRAALAKVDEEELAFGVGERAYRKRAALLEARDAAAVAVFGAPALRALLLDDAKPRARRELLRLLSLARDAVRWYPRIFCGSAGSSS